MSLPLPFKACLFDLDGTLVDSSPAVNRSWFSLFRRHNLDPFTMIHQIHGRPAHESIRDLLSFESDDVIQQEIDWLQHMESTDVEGVVAIDGAVDFLKALDALGAPWAIVTSGTIPVATARAKAAGIPINNRLITANDITRGKPHPEPFLKGADLLGVEPSDCIVFEDAAAGITAGLAAGAMVIGVTATETSSTRDGVPTIYSYDELAAELDGDHFRMVRKA